MRYILLLAFIPVFVIALYVYKRDVYKKEPIKELLKAFAGGIGAAAGTIFVNYLLTLSGLDLESNVFVRAYISAGTIEECMKFAFLYFLFWNNPHFDERFDGVVYAVFVSLGFAFVENVMYIYDDLNNALTIARSRALFAVPAHALFAIAMGYGMGLAKFSKKRSRLLIGGGLLTAIFIHGTYDFLLMFSDQLSKVNESFSSFILLLFYIFVALMWVFGFKRMKRLNEEDRWHL